MAILKQRLHKKNSNGTYDVVHLETSASLVLMSDGTTVEAAINGKAASSHNHAASNITSGTLVVARGGTGRNTLTAGSYLVGNGTGIVGLKTKEEVKADLGANIPIQDTEPEDSDVWIDTSEEDYEEEEPDYTYGTNDLTAGSSPLETGKLHFVYE